MSDTGRKKAQREARDILKRARLEARDIKKAARSESRDIKKAALKEVKERKKKRGSAGTSRTKKDRFLHTRVPEELERRIKEKAEEMSVPVSLLIRNILTQAFQD